MRKYLILPIVLFVFLIPEQSFAEHKSAVAGSLINSDDAGISQGEECDGAAHYHGELNGASDPDPHGCGHGVVTAIAHGEGDGESLPPPPAPGMWDSFVGWLKKTFTKENTMNVIDVAAEANGIPPPGTISDAVDITREATPSIMENVDNIEQYRESIDPEDDTMGIYNDLADVPDNPTISQRFFRWFNTLVD